MVTLTKSINFDNCYYFNNNMSIGTLLVKNTDIYSVEEQITALPHYSNTAIHIGNSPKTCKNYNIIISKFANSNLGVLKISGNFIFITKYSQNLQQIGSYTLKFKHKNGLIPSTNSSRAAFHRKILYLPVQPYESEKNNTLTNHGLWRGSAVMLLDFGQKKTPRKLSKRVPTFGSYYSPDLGRHLPHNLNPVGVSLGIDSTQVLIYRLWDHHITAYSLSGDSLRTFGEPAANDTNAKQIGAFVWDWSMELNAAYCRWDTTTVQYGLPYVVQGYLLRPYTVYEKTKKQLYIQVYNSSNELVKTLHVGAYDTLLDVNDNTVYCGLLDKKKACLWLSAFEFIPPKD